MLKIGIIGGSGLDNPDILKDARDLEINTPYGPPSSPLKLGKIGGLDVVLLARHGHHHTIPPSQVNFRANIHALKEQGCTHLLATSACGSLRENIKRGDFVVVDQFIDFTHHRKITFYEEFPPGGENAKHTSMSNPFSPQLREILINTARELNIPIHEKGTVITIEGPRFSTRAESRMFRAWGADVINMSLAPEAILANEAGLPYAAIAMSTDFDCWKEDEEPVEWKEILKVFGQNVKNVIQLLLHTLPKIKELEEKNALKIKTLNIPFDLKSKIRTIPHWPKQGVMFRDITTLIKNPEAFDYAISQFKEHCQNKNIQKIAGIESRGFIFGAALARELGLPFILIRKKGKLPAETVSQEYALEYGTDKIEIHKDAVDEGDNVLIVDDLLATGGTASAACKLIEKLNGKVAGCAFVIDLPELKGKEKLKDYPVFNLIEFEGE